MRQRAGGRRATTQQMAATLGEEIVEVQQRLRRGAVGIVDDRRRGIAEQRRHALGLELRRIDAGRVRARREDMREMRLAAAGRAVERQRRRRPLRPAIEPGDRLGIARRDEEIGTAQRRAMTEIERQLHLSLRRRPVGGIVERAGEIAAEREADEHADHRRRRQSESTPTKPSTLPKASSAKITQTG